MTEPEEWVPEPRPGWETRLARVAVRHVRQKKPNKIVFVSQDANMDCDFTLAVERHRSSYSPLLLSPAIGQRAGEFCEGEIGRRGAVEQCRHDSG